MKNVFLETHNLKNLYSGFGQFNYHLIKALYENPVQDFKIELHAKNTNKLEKEFGNYFSYKKYNKLSRHKLFRIRKKYDLWHCLNQNIKIEPSNNIPYLLTIHDIHFVLETPEHKKEEVFSNFKEKLNRCSAIVYISEFTKKDTHAWFDVPNVPEYVIYNGNPITEFIIKDNYKPTIQPNLPFLFSIGAFTERKNFISLVEMLRLLPKYSLVIAGNDRFAYTNKLKSLVSQYGLQNRVIFAGKLDDMEKQYYLKNCEAFVFPSLREGFGLPPIEAMRFGKPVFLSNNTSLPEIGGEHSFYWDHYDPEYMVDIFKKGMEKYQNNTSFYKKWYQEQAKSFSWNHTAKEYIKVYKSLL